MEKDNGIIFLVGIKGVGMTGLATLYNKWGYKVIGSDTEEEFFTDRILREMGIKIVSFDEKHVTNQIGLLVYSSAYDKDHPQIKKARGMGIHVQSYMEDLAQIFNARRGIAVTGSHGKTTTTAMLGRILEDAGLDPTVVVGSEIIEWGATARAGKSEWMVAEGDEYQAKVLLLKPYMSIIGNIDYDHPDYYKDEKEYVNMFKKFLADMPSGTVTILGEEIKKLNIRTRAKVIWFGKSADRELMDSLDLHVLGEHNILNAVAAFKAARWIGVEEKVIRKSLANFKSTRRRLEYYTDRKADVVLIDDYAHHPEEVRSTLKAVREFYPSRHIVAVFHPHTYSRTRAFLSDFAKSFSAANSVVLLDVYASQREKDAVITGEDLFSVTKKYHNDVYFTPTLHGAQELLLEKFMSKGGVIIVMGAGDVWKIVRDLSGMLALSGKPGS